MIILKFLLWTWQLPQHLLGLLLILFSRAKKDEIEGIQYWRAPKLFNAGISLGNYIIMDETYHKRPKYLVVMLKHERGHSKQSKYLGPLYLIVVGLFSITRNIWQRVFHKTPGTHREWVKEMSWYYNGYPENWANKLAGITPKDIIRS